MARYPVESDVLFADSTHNFAPFELHEKRWFSTRSVDGYSTDSVTFFVKTFEIDSLQFLRLPVYELAGSDSIVHLTPFDSINLVHTVASIPDSLSVMFLQEDTDYYRIDSLLNYPFVIAFSVLGIIALVVLWLLFGKKILRTIAIRRLRRNNEKFIEKYDWLVQQIEREKLHLDSESVLSYWKSYMERIDHLPYRKLTTKEIAGLKDDHTLVDA
ncbi:MAG: hypothetical protein HKN32_05715, partial [Flavobacteriales bacterium]|nr:hypothetical protein [Flavobacteriales bacterium]